MNFKVNILVFLTLLLCGFYVNSFSQRINIDSVPAQAPVDSVFTDSLSNNVEYSPGDMIFIPADLLYDYNWDNERIRTTKFDLTGRTDTTVIVLRKDSEHVFVFPHKGKLLSPFGPRHRRIHAGTDVKLYEGDSILCAFDGKVRIAKRYKGYGNMVLVRHNNGLETLYGHMSKILVDPNDIVKAGDLLGLGGRTGHATTEHLHFETRLWGEPFNSAQFIDYETFALTADTLFITGKTFEIKRPTKSASAHTVKKNNSTTAPPPEKVSPATKTTPPVKEQNNGSPVYHTIRKGDSFYKIAKKYKTTMDTLCKLNKCTTKKLLLPGKKFRVR